MTNLMRYATGEVAKVGDHVSYDGELSVVEEIIDENHILFLEGVVRAPGLMLTNRREGRVFVPDCVINQYKFSDCLLLVQRCSSQEIDPEDGN